MEAAIPWLGVTQPSSRALTHPNNTGPTARLTLLTCPVGHSLVDFVELAETCEVQKCRVSNLFQQKMIYLLSANSPRYLPGAKIDFKREIKNDIDFCILDKSKILTLKKKIRRFLIFPRTLMAAGYANELLPRLTTG